MAFVARRRDRPSFLALTETKLYKREGDIAGDTTVTLVDVKGKTITIEYLDFASNHGICMLRIFPYNEDGTLGPELGISTKDGLGTVYVSPNAINAHKSDLWKELVYDTVNNYYKFELTRQIALGNGVRIQIRNPVGEPAHKVTCQALLAFHNPL